MRRGRTDVTKLIVGFQNSANVPKKYNIIIWISRHALLTGQILISQNLIDPLAFQTKYSWEGRKKEYERHDDRYLK